MLIFKTPEALDRKKGILSLKVDFSVLLLTNSRWILNCFKSIYKPIKPERKSPRD
jgi:hypothetical protein